MFGILYALFNVIGTEIQNGIERKENNTYRKEAINKNKPYYIGYRGEFHDTKTGHMVQVKVHDNNWDLVDKDMVTGKTLRNYSQEERNNFEKKFQKDKEKAKIDRMNILNGISTNKIYYDVRKWEDPRLHPPGTYETFKCNPINGREVKGRCGRYIDKETSFSVIDTDYEYAVDRNEGILKWYANKNNISIEEAKKYAISIGAIF